MKSYKLDFSQLAKEKVGMDPSIRMVGIGGDNGGFCLLTKNHSGKYFWSDLTSSYRIQRINEKHEFDDAWHAISNALQDKWWNEIFEFKDLADFCDWYLKEEKKKEKLRFKQANP